MLSFDMWKDAFTAAVRRSFGSRIVCAGVQGSRARGEAREGSDIDTVLILDRLSAADLDEYRSLLKQLPNADLVCGFVSDRESLLHWDRGELVGFYFDTRCLLGSLDFLLPLLSRDAARKSAHQAACGLYHMLCHASVFESAPIEESAFAKGVFFLLRTKRYSETGEFPLRLSDLLPLLSEPERALLLPLSGKQTSPIDRENALILLSKWIEQLD